MSDTTTCPSCSATLPAGAAFCTTCGTRMEAAAAPVAEAPSADPTRVDTPGLHDATQVYAPPPPAAPPAPWQPADAGPPAPPAPTPAAWGAPAAPTGWDAPASPPVPPPAAPPPAAWPQPAAPAPAAPPTWGAPGAAPMPPQTWQQPGAPAWGAQPAAPPASSGGGSPLGGVAALLGSVLVLVGLFTAWLGTNVGEDTITGWDLVKKDSGFETSDPYLLLGLGIAGIAIAALLFAGKARTPARIAALLVGVAVIGTHARDWMDIADIAKKLPQGVEITAQFGFYLGIAGGVVLIVSALLPAKK